MEGTLEGWNRKTICILRDNIVCARQCTEIRIGAGDNSGATALVHVRDIISLDQVVTMKEMRSDLK